MPRKAILEASSDLHLAQRAWVKHPELTGDAYYGLEQLVDFALDNELPLCFAGDTLDKTRPDPTTIHVLRSQIERLKIDKLPLLYCDGQHELDRTNHWLSAISDWPTHIHRQSYNLDGTITLYGLDWTPASSVIEELDNVPNNTDILISHQVWRDFMGTRIAGTECSFADVPFVKMIITGDFHKHVQISTLNKTKDELIVLSPGPTCMQAIDEDPNKYFYVIYDDLSYKSIKLKTRQCFRVEINTEEELEIFLSGNIDQVVTPQQDVPDNIAKNIVHIIYNDTIAEVYRRITAVLSTKVHLFMAPRKRTIETILIDQTRKQMMAGSSLTTYLELLVDKDTRLYKDLTSLLTSNNPKAQLASIHDAFVQERLKVII